MSLPFVTRTESTWSMPNNVTEQPLADPDENSSKRQPGSSFLAIVYPVSGRFFTPVSSNARPHTTTFQGESQVAPAI